MTEQNPELDPRLAVQCLDCYAPPRVPCRTSYGDTVHATRQRAAHLAALERGTCALCGHLLVRGTPPDVEDDPTIQVWHPETGVAAACPPLPDPGTHWNAYAAAIQAGARPGHPGPEHFVPLAAIEDAAAMRVHGSGYDAVPRVAVEVGLICPECDNGKHVNCDGRAMHPVTDELSPCSCTHGVEA